MLCSAGFGDIPTFFPADPLKLNQFHFGSPQIRPVSHLSFWPPQQHDAATTMLDCCQALLVPCFLLTHCSELRPVIIEFLITSLPETLFSPLLRLVGQSSLGKVLVLPNLLHFCGLGSLQGSRSYFSCPGLCLHTIVSLSSGDGPFDLVASHSDMHCRLWHISQKIKRNEGPPQLKSSSQQRLRCSWTMLIWVVCVTLTQLI